METCSQKCRCAICDRFLSNKMCITPGGNLKAWCPFCQIYIEVDNFKIVKKDEKNERKEKMGSPTCDT
jgi:hypothetical protein